MAIKVRQVTKTNGEKRMRAKNCMFYQKRAAVTQLSPNVANPGDL